MRVLIFGSRSLTWRHLEVMRLVASHSIREEASDLRGWMETATKVDEEESRFAWAAPLVPDSEPLVLIHGDGPPGGSVPCAIGADRLSELACMEKWPERRRVRRFPVEQRDGESWGHAAARRNAAMVAARPHRAYCIHTDLDSSTGSRMTAEMLQNATIRFWYVRVTQAGAVLSVESR